MIRATLWITLFALAGCAVTHEPIKVEPLPRPTLKMQLSSLDPSDGVDEAVLVLGTDDDLFNGQINMQQYYLGCMSMWMDEIRQHLEGDMVLFMSHGGSIGGMWVCEYGPPYLYSLDAVVADLRRKMGPHNATTPIILLVCNEWAYEITTDAHVWYGRYNIFLVPDAAVEAWGGSNRRNLLECGQVVIGDWSDFVQSSVK